MIKKVIHLKEGRITEKLDDLVNYHEELMEDLPSKDDFIEDRLSRRGIEKTIELIADLIVDITLIIISEAGFDKPEDSRSAILILEKNKLLSENISKKIQDFVSFRNLLVHRYGKIDENMEFNNIKENHRDVLDFVKEIKNFLVNQS